MTSSSVQKKDRECGNNAQRDEDEKRDPHANREAVGKRALTGVIETAWFGSGFHISPQAWPIKRRRASWSLRSPFEERCGQARPAREELQTSLAVGGPRDRRLTCGTPSCAG